LNLLSPGITYHPLAPFFAPPFLCSFGPRCSRDKLEQEDAENVLRKTDQPLNCTAKQWQKEHLTVKRKWDRSGSAGAEDTDQRRGQV